MMNCHSTGCLERAHNAHIVISDQIGNSPGHPQSSYEPLDPPSSDSHSHASATTCLQGVTKHRPKLRRSVKVIMSIVHLYILVSTSVISVINYYLQIIMNSHYVQDSGQSRAVSMSVLKRWFPASVDSMVTLPLSLFGHR